MILSIVPALVAWIALFLEFTTGFWVLALAFALLFGLDVAAAERNRAPAWYPRLRRPVTILVVACLVLAALSA